MNKDPIKKRIRKNYSRKLEEIADEFKFSDDVLRSDQEIDDRHLIANLDIVDDDEDDDLKINRK